VAPCSIGNPIQPYNGNKTESHVDYATADGLLSVKRQFLGQYLGWRMPGDPSLLDLYSQTRILVGVSFTKNFSQGGVVRAVTLNSPFIRRTANGEVLVVNADGSRMQHPASATGTFPADVSGARIEQLPPPPRKVPLGAGHELTMP